MKRITFLLIFLLTFTANAQKNTAFRQVEGFSHPESVVLDHQKELLYVSNMADKEKGDGFISKVSPEGEILKKKWITGLDDPKGLHVHGDTLYVSDVTVLVIMDNKKGTVIKKLPVPGANSLNDITADEMGNLYISDLSGNKIFKYDRSGKISEWSNDPALKQPNGLLKLKDGMLVASWGKDEPGKLLRIDTSGKCSELTPGIGNLDGIQKRHSESFLFSDWATGDIYEVNAVGNLQKLISSAKSSGDFLFLEDTEMVILPMNFQNSLWWYSLED
ncbi:SMP-30/gluconolactonase/LRE family protein [Salinimicrobium soli]|uniref:SMP-30/gluconolactonase/LRE family protein n=1 Tax=Salinimicrobium soli TaxID=1254399 RepID=UPI003AAAE7F4